MKTALQRILALAFVLPLVSGCISPKSYVDPTFGKVKYDDLTRRAEPYKWRIVVEFQRNGTHLPSADNSVLSHVERVVRASGMAIPSTEPNVGELKVIINNVADRAASATKGFGTGLTFGLIGSTVTDFYEMDVVLIENGKTIQKAGYKHALHTTIGNADGPEGLEPMTTSAAFGIVIEQLMLNALKDLEREKQSSSNPSSGGVSLLERLRATLLLVGELVPDTFSRI